MALNEKGFWSEKPPRTIHPWDVTSGKRPDQEPRPGRLARRLRGGHMKARAAAAGIKKIRGQWVQVRL